MAGVLGQANLHFPFRKDQTVSLTSPLCLESGALPQPSPQRVQRLHREHVPPESSVDDAVGHGPIENWFLGLTWVCRGLRLGLRVLEFHLQAFPRLRGLQGVHGAVAGDPQGSPVILEETQLCAVLQYPGVGLNILPSFQSFSRIRCSSSGIILSF